MKKQEAGDANLADIIALSQKYDYHKTYIKGAYIDAKDTINNWCSAEIKDVDEEKQLVYVHYEAWAYRYDDVSEPFVMIRHSKQLVIKQLLSGDIHTDIQGRLEMHTESLSQISKPFKNTNPKSRSLLLLIFYASRMMYSDSINLCEGIYISLLIQQSLYKKEQFLNNSPQLSSSSIISSSSQSNGWNYSQNMFNLQVKDVMYQYELGQQYPQLFMVDMRCAIAQCGPEMFSVLGKIFGKCDRCYRFFKEVIYTGQVDTKHCNPNLRGHSFQKAIINEFCELKGFQKMGEFLNLELPDKESPDLLDPKVGAEFFDLQKKVLLARLQNLSDKDIKEISKDLLQNLIQLLHSIMTKLEERGVDEIIEKLELQLALKFMKSPFFERKVRGINDLRDLLQRAINAENKKSKYNYDTRARTSKWINYERFSEYLINESIMEHIYGPNGNPEFIKRSDQFFKVMAYTNKFTPQHIDLLWNAATQNKFEEVVRQTHSVIIELVGFVETPIISQFFQKIQSLETPQIDEKVLDFLKEYTVMVLKNKEIRKMMQGSANASGSGKLTGLMNTFKGNRTVAGVADPKKFYDLDIFWNLISNPSATSKNKDAASQALIDVLSHEEASDFRDMYVERAVNKLKESDSLRVLNFLKSIIKAYGQDARRDATSSIQRTIADMNNKYSLIDLCLANVQQYMKQANKQISIEENVGKDKPIKAMILTGQNTHEEHINQYLSFIEFLVFESQGKLALTTGHTDKLFQIFIKEALPNSDYEKSKLFEQLTKENIISSGRHEMRTPFLTDSVKKHVFLNLMSKTAGEFTNSEKSYNCFQHMFISANQAQQNLKWDPQLEKAHSITTQDFLGYQQMLKVAIEARDEKIREKAQNFIVDLNLQVQCKTLDLVVEKNKKFIQNCFALLQQTDQKYNVLSLVLNYLHRYDGKHITSEDHLYEGQQFTQLRISVQERDTHEKKEILIKSEQKVDHFRRKIADAFGRKINEFRICTKDGFLGENEFQTPLKEYNNPTVIAIQYVKQEQIEKEFPRFLLSNSKELDLLIQMVKTCNEREARLIFEILDYIPPNRQF